MKRKLLSVLLVAAMVATCLVGCGGSKEEAPAAEGSTAAAEATEAEPAGGAENLLAHHSKDLQLTTLTASRSSLRLTPVHTGRHL